MVNVTEDLRLKESKRILKHPAKVVWHMRVCACERHSIEWGLAISIVERIHTDHTHTRTHTCTHTTLSHAHK